MNDNPQYGSGPAPPEAVRDMWLQMMKPIAGTSRYDKVPSIKATTPAMHEAKRQQEYWLNRNVFAGNSEAYREGYERIQWNKQTTKPCMSRSQES